MRPDPLHGNLICGAIQLFNNNVNATDRLSSHQIVCVNTRPLTDPRGHTCDAIFFVVGLSLYPPPSSPSPPSIPLLPLPMN